MGGLFSQALVIPVPRLWAPCVETDVVVSNILDRERWTVWGNHVILLNNNWSIKYVFRLLKKRGGPMSQTTKRALEASLKNLLLQKPLDKITISDIAEDCGVNRMTVYYHFKDIYDLVEWSCVEDAAKALEGKKTYATWQQGFLQIFNAVLDNKPFIMNVYHSVSREHVETYLYKLTYDLLIGVVEEKAIGMDVSESDKIFIADFYKFAFVGLMLDWIKKGMKEDPQRIIERLGTLIHGDITKALKNYQRQN